MVTRACISINNRCNLNCTYCHFHEKKDYIQEDNMDVITMFFNPKLKNFVPRAHVGWGAMVLDAYFEE